MEKDKDTTKLVPTEQLSGEKQENVAVTSADSQNTTVLCGRIRLQNGVSKCNFCTMLLVSLTSIALLVFLNAMQSFLLTSSYGVETKRIGTITGYLGLADEVWSIVTLGLWGTVSDHIGRRNVVALGYLHIIIACLLIPNGNKVFPGLLLSRLLFAQGASALTSMMSALLADYVLKEDSGKATGLVGLMSGLGAILSVFVLVGQLPNNICIDNTYYVVSILSLAMMGLTYFGLQNLKTFTSATNYLKPESKNPLKLLFAGTKAAYHNRNLGLAYLGGFLARGDSVLISVFVSLWVNKYFLDEGICFTRVNGTDPELSTCGENLLNPDKADCPEAFTRYSIISGTAQTVSLFVAPILGVLGDRIDPVKIVFWTALIGAICFGLVFAINNVEDGIAIIVVMLWSCSQISLVISAQMLLIKNIPQDMKGTVAGCFSLVGALGVMTFTYVGGVLFDEWFEGAPFVMAMVFSIILFISATITYVKNKSQKKAIDL